MSDEKTTSPRWVLAESQGSIKGQGSVAMTVTSLPQIISTKEKQSGGSIETGRGIKKPKKSPADKHIKEWVEGSKSQDSQSSSPRGQDSSNRRDSRFDDEDDDSDEYDYNYNSTSYENSKEAEPIRRGTLAEIQPAKRTSSPRDRSDSSKEKEIKFPNIPGIKPRIPSNPSIDFKAKKALKQKNSKKFKRACKEVTPVKSQAAAITAVKISVSSVRPTEIVSLPETGLTWLDNSSSSSLDSCSTCTDSSPDYQQVSERRASRRRSSRRPSGAVLLEDEDSPDPGSKRRKHKKKKHRHHRRASRRRSSVTFGEMPKHVPTGIGRRVRPRFKVKKHKKHKDRDRDKDQSDEEGQSRDRERRASKTEQIDKEDIQPAVILDTAPKTRLLDDTSSESSISTSVILDFSSKPTTSGQLIDSMGFEVINPPQQHPVEGNPDLVTDQVTDCESGVSVSLQPTVVPSKEEITKLSQEKSLHEGTEASNNLTDSLVIKNNVDDSTEPKNNQIGEDCEHKAEKKKSKKSKKEKKKKKDSIDEYIDDEEDMANRYKFDASAAPRKSILKSQSPERPPT